MGCTADEGQEGGVDSVLEGEEEEREDREEEEEEDIKRKKKGRKKETIKESSLTNPTEDGSVFLSIDTIQHSEYQGGRLNPPNFVHLSFT